MDDLPETRNSLLVRLCDRSDREAWAEFASIYEPALYRLARGRGLQHADALDLTQEILWAVSRAIGRFNPDRERARFRTWLFRIARNLAVNALVRGGRLRGTGDSDIVQLLQQAPARDEPEATAFDLEFRREAFQQAAARVQQDVAAKEWQSFWLTSVEGIAIDETARRLSSTVGAVYAARSRVLARLRKCVERYEGR